ncbi:hypothetical protein ACWGR4_01760 [Embleya sp. NPDC055664]
MALHLHDQEMSLCDIAEQLVCARAGGAGRIYRSIPADLSEVRGLRTGRRHDADLVGEFNEQVGVPQNQTSGQVALEKQTAYPDTSGACSDKPVVAGQALRRDQVREVLLKKSGPGRVAAAEPRQDQVAWHEFPHHGVLWP